MSIYKKRHLRKVLNCMLCIGWDGELRESLIGKV